MLQSSRLGLLVYLESCETPFCFQDSTNKLSALVALSVYVVGGIVYQRTVMHQRGWRQLPNYALWSGITSFVSDMFIIVFGSCARCLPRRRGYSQVSQDHAGTGRNEDENRLIGELDEEWED